LFVWQQNDRAPDFPPLFEFLDHRRQEIGAALHSLRVAHNQRIRPAEWRALDGVFEIQCARIRVGAGEGLGADRPPGAGGMRSDLR